MALFGKRRSGVVSASVISTLAEYGKAVLASRSGEPVDSRFEWDYVGPVVMAMNGPARDQVIQELYDASHAASSQPLVAVGAYSLLKEWDPKIRDERFLELCDISLEYMRQLRYSSGHLTGYEADRWIEIHGDLRSSFDRIVDVVVPDSSEPPAHKGLSLGENRLLALTGPAPSGNEFYAERRSDGEYIVFSVRPRSADDPTRGRYEENYIPGGPVFKSMPDLLRAVGEMFGVKPYWADDDLEPYFPGRRALSASV